MYGLFGRSKPPKAESNIFIEKSYCRGLNASKARKQRFRYEIIPEVDDLGAQCPQGQDVNGCFSPRCFFANEWPGRIHSQKALFSLRISYVRKHRFSLRTLIGKSIAWELI